jgi:beta-glucanase (GH16 family)
LGTGNVQFVPYASGSITDYHTYEIKWLPNQVSWWIDGHLVRTETRHVPAGPMKFHLNIWVPDPGWPAAYDPALKPATSASSNQVFSMSVDSVHIQAISPAPAGERPPHRKEPD